MCSISCWGDACFFLQLNSPLMCSCLNSESIFLSILLWRGNSNAKALWLCVCLAVFVGFSNMNFTSLNAHQRMWVGEKKQCWGEERKEEDRREGDSGTEDQRRGEREGARGFSFFFPLFVMKSRSDIMLCFETNPPKRGIFLPFT